MDTPTSPFVYEPDSPRHTRDPHPDYAWLRSNAPVYYWQARDAIVVSSAAALRQMFSDERLSLDIRNWAHYAGEQLFSQPRYEAWRRSDDNGLFRLSSADHARVRKLASVALTPRAVRRMDAQIEATVVEILERMSEGQELLDVSAFAEAVPMTVISDILGIPEADRGAFRRFGTTVIKAVIPSQDIEVLNGIADTYTEGRALMLRVIAERRAMSEPPEDMLSDLIHATEDGERLNDDELISLATALIVAGSDTTVHATCYAVYHLLKRPEALAEVRADRSLLRGAIEESLRYDLFGKSGVFRYALEDFEWDGVPVRKGQMIMGLIGAAGRDPELYDEPDRFDIHREHRSDLTFGLGRHFCLGANLARSELIHAVGKLLIDYYPEATLEAEPELDFHNPLMRAMKSLPLRLGPKAVQG